MKVNEGNLDRIIRVVFTVDTQNELSDREICIRTPSETFFADLGRYPYPGGSISI